MKFVILLLAFFIPLLTSTRALQCFHCSTIAEVVNATGVSNCAISNTAITCPAAFKDPETTYCMTFFKTDGEVFKRSCISLTDIMYSKSTFIKKPGCQPFVNELPKMEGTICLCYNGHNCNKIKKPTPNIDSNTVKIVGMSVATLLGGVLALSLINPHRAMCFRCYTKGRALPIYWQCKSA